MKKDIRKGDRHKPENRKKDRHRPGYIRPDRRNNYTGVPDMSSKEKKGTGDKVPLHVSKDLMFTSWADFLQRTIEEERMYWCRNKARTANRNRLMSGKPTITITTEDVWEVLKSYQGHCRYCGSLALENRPSKPNGAPLQWEHIGRRIGSLEHINRRFAGGENNHDNLAWACLWCNTWRNERKKGAPDHAGLYTFDPPYWEKEGHNWNYKIGTVVIGTVSITPKRVAGQTLYHWSVDGGEYLETTSTQTGKYFVERNSGELDIRKILIPTDYEGS